MNSQASGMMATTANSVLVVVDVQEKLFPVCQEKELLEQRVQLLMEGAQVLGIPIIVTEQYVRGLGHTIDSLGKCASAAVVEKTTFSCFGNENFRQTLRSLERTCLVLCGIEAHICVAQTALDGIGHGYDVVVAEDAISTRLPHTKALGIAKMRQHGAKTDCTEGVLFTWLGQCDRPEFKQLLPLFKESI